SGAYTRGADGVVQVESDDDDFAGMISRSSDGDGGPGAVAAAARDGSGRAVPVVPVGPRKRPITMPPGAAGSAPSLEPTAVDRAAMERTVRGLEPVGRVLTTAEVERMLAALLSPTQLSQLDARGYVDAALDVDGAGRLRANISRFRGGVKGSFRLVMATPPTL